MPTAASAPLISTSHSMAGTPPRERRFAFALAASIAIAFASTTVADAFEAHGTIDAVTVYRGQALVSRVVELPESVGLNEIIVGDLPEFIVPASLYAESSEGVDVRSISATRSRCAISEKWLRWTQRQVHRAIALAGWAGAGAGSGRPSAASRSPMPSSTISPINSSFSTS